MRLTPRIHLLASGRLGLAFSDPYDCNAYAIEAGDEIVLVDAGVRPSAAPICDGLLAAGLDPGRITTLLLTHAHLDHAGATAAIKDATGCQACGSAEARRRLASGDEETIGLGAARTAGYYGPEYVFMPSELDRTLRQSDQLAFDGCAIRVLETPGHSADHLSYLAECDGQRVLFAGDLVFHQGRIALQNVPDCDIAAYVRSLELLRDEPVDMLLAGHFSPVLSDGSYHISAALDIIDRLGIPANI